MGLVRRWRVPTSGLSRRVLGNLIKTAPTIHRGGGFQRRSSFYKFPAGDLAVEQAALLIELEDHFNLLEASFFADQDFAANVKGFSFFVIFQAGLIINIHLTLDDLSAAFALNVKGVEFA
jgi:hypothetical protein